VLVEHLDTGLNPTVWAQMKYGKEEFPFMHFTQFYILVAQRGEDRFFNLLLYCYQDDRSRTGKERGDAIALAMAEDWKQPSGAVLLPSHSYIF
jgi:hypothetical protein